MAEVSTNADPGVTGWAIRDPVIQLRRFGTDRSFALRGAERWIVGASAECDLLLDDPTGRVSRRHAVLERDGDGWLLTDLGSTNGIRQDGEDRKAFPLAPGMEIGIGGFTLIAESARSLGLRELLCRFIGWSAARATDVDHAMRAVRDMANLRAWLVLRGAGDLSGVARRLHDSALGDTRPFVVHARDEPGVAALARAVDGSLFLDAIHLPADVANVVISLRLPETRVRLMVGATDDTTKTPVPGLISHVVTIRIPALDDRADELERLLLAYGDDAAAQLGAPDVGLRPQDPRWICDAGIATLEDAEDVMRRMVALRTWGVTGGAERLGITHGALSRWARRRKIPT